MRRDDVTISDIGLALLMLDQERQRNLAEIHRLDAKIQSMRLQKSLMISRNEDIDETIKRVRSAT